jgi:hypothetical protein
MMSLHAPFPADASGSVATTIAEGPTVSGRASLQRITADGQHEGHRNLLAAECPALPVIQPGELWVVEHASADQALSPLCRHLLTSASIVVYDPALYSIVAANLPVGGYAEPTAAQEGPFDTPINRCIQFARDGWSVVRLSRHGSLKDRRIAWLIERMIGAGCSTSMSVRLFTDANGSIPQRTETELGRLDATTAEGCVAIAFAVVGTGAGPHLYAISSNGLAG